MSSKLIIFILMLAAFWSCRAYQIGHDRKPASVNIEVHGPEDKLLELHYYTLIAHKHELAGLHLKVQAARLQIEKIEQEILTESKHALPKVRRSLESFAEVSPLHADSVHHLAQKLNIRFPTAKYTSIQLEKELASLKLNSEFQVFETNVEHLSYMLETNARF